MTINAVMKQTESNSLFKTLEYIQKCVKSVFQKMDTLQLLVMRWLIKMSQPLDIQAPKTIINDAYRMFAYHMQEKCSALWSCDTGMQVTSCQ